MKIPGAPFRAQIRTKTTIFDFRDHGVKVESCFGINKLALSDWINYFRLFATSSCKKPRFELIPDDKHISPISLSCSMQGSADQLQDAQALLSVSEATERILRLAGAAAGELSISELVASA